jgi:hypothetical protein
VTQDLDAAINLTVPTSPSPTSCSEDGCGHRLSPGALISEILSLTLPEHRAQDHQGDQE